MSESRMETLLNALINGEKIDFTPRSRAEQYLKNCIEGCGCDGLPAPKSRLDALLYALADKISQGGGGNIEPLIITANGTYEATEEINGYAPITVAVASGEEIDPADALKTVIDKLQSASYILSKKVGLDEEIQACLRYDVTENATNVSHMFWGCQKLTKVPLLNLSKVKSMPLNTSEYGGMDYMFCNCRALEDVPEFDISHLDNLRWTFEDCDKLKFPNWVAEFEGDLMEVFKQCPFTNQEIKNITFKCRSAQSIFVNGCDLLEIENIQFPNITSSKSLFRNCYASKISNVTLIGSTSSAFAECPFLTEIVGLKMVNTSDLYYTFRKCTALTTIDIDSIENPTYTQLSNTFSECSALLIAPLLDTKNVTSFGSTFYKCTSLKTIPVYDVRNVTSFGSVFNNCSALEVIGIVNIGANLQVGSGTSWGHKLTVDSLVHLIYECRDMGGSRTLTIGSANLAKLASVYVKLVDITDEMRAEDEFIDVKLPFVVCESTDEGAGLITDYVGLKNWSLA